MDTHFLVKGMILGFCIAAPVGPIGVLCIRKTLQFGRFPGLVSGLGAAVADTLYGAIAAFGLSSLSTILIEGKFWLRLIGGAFLIYLGVRTFFSKPQEQSNQVTHKTLLGDFISTFLLTMTNPLTILSYVAIFAALGLSQIEVDHFDAISLVLGVFLGSAFWWIILCEGVTLFRKKVSVQVMSLVNRLAGVIILGFGSAVLFSLF